MNICDSWVKIYVLNSFFFLPQFSVFQIDKRKIKLGRWIKRDVCSFLHRTASCFRASLELCFCVFSLFSVEMIRAVLTVEAQQLYCLTCSRILGPNLSQSRHICRKQKTSKAALVDIFLSFKLGSFSVSISRLLCSHISCSSSAHKPENQTRCLFLMKYSDFLVKSKRVVPYSSRRCRWRPCLLKSSWCSGSVMHTSKQNVKWTNQNLTKWCW